MPLTLKAQMILDSNNLFFNKNDVAEDVVYTAKNEMPKTVTVYIDREAMTPEATDDRINSRRSVVRNYLIDRVTLFVSKDITNGIPTVTEGFDLIDLPVKIGGRVETLKVSRVIQDLPGLWMLEVEK